MPQLQRPNSDVQRLKLLRAAKAKANVTAPADLAFSAATLAVLNTVLPTLTTEMQERSSALAAQNAASVAANPERKRLALWVSHFIQVYNLAVERGDMPADGRAFYQLPVGAAHVPPMRNDPDRLRWGNNIVDGDAARVAAGGAAMSNPTAAAVGSRLAALNAALGALSPLKDAYNAEQEDVENMRPEVDDLIDDIIDEVLFTFRKHDAPSQRRNAREYGLTYVPSPGELPSPTEYSLQGAATDIITGAALDDVEVLVVELAVSVLTDLEGLYLLPLVAPGTYTIRFSKAGYEDLTVPNVAITAGTIPTLNAAMKPLV